MLKFVCEKEISRIKMKKQRKGVTNEEHYKETCSVLSGMDIGLHNSCNRAWNAYGKSSTDI
mgnify:CR=1 FL=1